MHLSDAHCVRMYDVVRDGIPESAPQIGYPYNRFPSSPALSAHLARCIVGFAATGRTEEYVSSADEKDQAFAAAVLDEYLGLRGFEGPQVHFTNSSTESIVIVVTHLAQRSIGLMLPLPVYFGFDHAASTAGAVICGYYRWDGSCVLLDGPPAGGWARVSVVPNGVTGSTFRDPSTPAGWGPPAFDIVDVVCQTGIEGSGVDVHELVRNAVHRVDMRRAALMLTPSKDLSIPSLRSALLATGDDRLLEHIARDRSAARSACRRWSAS